MAVTCPWGGKDPTRSSNAESLEKSTWDLKTQVLWCLWVHPAPISKAISLLFFDLPKGVMAGACVFVLDGCLQLWSSPGSTLACPSGRGTWAARRRTFLLLEAPGARVDHYVEHQRSAGQDGLPVSSATSFSFPLIPEEHCSAFVRCLAFHPWFKGSGMFTTSWRCENASLFRLGVWPSADHVSPSLLILLPILSKLFSWKTCLFSVLPVYMAITT